MQTMISNIKTGESFVRLPRYGCKTRFINSKTISNPIMLKYVISFSLTIMLVLNRRKITMRIMMPIKWD